MKGDGADNKNYALVYRPSFKVPNAQSTADCLLGGVTYQQVVVSI